MPKFAYIGVPTDIGGIGTFDLGGIMFPATFQTLQAQVYELTLSFSTVPKNGALQGILRIGDGAITVPSGTVAPLDEADAPALASPIRATAFPEGMVTVLNFAINNNVTYTWQAQDDDQRIVLNRDPDGDADNALTLGCITTVANAGLLAVAEFKFEST